MELLARSTHLGQGSNAVREDSVSVGLYRLLKVSVLNLLLALS